MSRRKAKSDRELITDLTDRTKLFCESMYDSSVNGCNNCPLRLYDVGDCRLAYISYILTGGGETDD